MKRLAFGKWEIETDLELTKEYYNNFTVAENDSQCYRNYHEFCKNMTDDEKGFFQAFGIDPLCCNVMSIGLTKEKYYPLSGSYYFAGKYIKKPEEIVMTIEELAEKDFIDDRPDPRVYIGRFQFTFMDFDSLFARIPEDMPEGFLCVEFFSDEMPWLLNEKPEQKLYYPPKPWQLVKKVRERIRHNKENENWREETKNQLIQLFDIHNINHHEMSKSEVENYMNRWFEEIVPNEKQKAAREHCFSTREYNCYLWHAFSYGDAPCTDGENAKIEFDGTERGEAVLILNYEKIGFILEYSNGITADELDEFNDIIISDKNFEWAYVHTHEQQCGPYFYQKASNEIID